MARHSKWHKVRQFKGAIDAKRAASFTKLGREITVATREKGADPAMNARLRVAVERARAASMPKDTIERAIQKGAGAGTDAQLETLTYEAYAPGGTALVIECVTDNRNRTANDVKRLVSKHGGTLASSGAVTYLFDRVALFRAPMPSHDRHDEVELALIDAGASQIHDLDGGLEVYSDPADFARLSDAFGRLGLALSEAEFSWIPKTLVETDEATGTSVAELIEILEENDDVSRVFSNLA